MGNGLMENIVIADKIERISILRNWLDLNNLKKCCVVDHFNNKIYFIRENCAKYQKLLIEKSILVTSSEQVNLIKKGLDTHIVNRLIENNIGKCDIIFIDNYHNKPNGYTIEFSI